MVYYVFEVYFPLAKLLNKFSIYTIFQGENEFSAAKFAVFA